MLTNQVPKPVRYIRASHIVTFILCASKDCRSVFFTNRYSFHEKQYKNEGGEIYFYLCLLLCYSRRQEEENPPKKSYYQ